MKRSGTCKYCRDDHAIRIVDCGEGESDVRLSPHSASRLDFTLVTAFAVSAVACSEQGSVATAQLDDKISGGVSSAHAIADGDR